MLNENVVETNVSTENVDSELITVKREDYERLVYERDEYRSMCHDFAGRIPKFHEIHERINDILGGVTR